MADNLKVLGQLDPAATTTTVLYTVPDKTQTTISSIVAANRTGSAITFRLSVHVAGAAAKNVISIHGPTNHHQSAPYSTKNNNVKIVSLKLPCSPCYDTDVILDCKTNRCMQELDASYVMDMIYELNL